MKLSRLMPAFLIALFLMPLCGAALADAAPPGQWPTIAVYDLAPCPAADQVAVDGRHVAVEHRVALDALTLMPARFHRASEPARYASPRERAPASKRKTLKADADADAEPDPLPRWRRT